MLGLHQQEQVSRHQNSYKDQEPGENAAEPCRTTDKRLATLQPSNRRYVFGKRHSRHENA